MSGFRTCELFAVRVAQVDDTRHGVQTLGEALRRFEHESSAQDSRRTELVVVRFGPGGVASR